MSILKKSIGGYFELELPKKRGVWYPQALTYQSARAAFYALLNFIKPKHVWVPFYICDSMLAPLYKANIDISFYSLNNDFSIRDDFSLKENEFLLYVNYFGICSEIQDAILSKYDKNQVIFDHSQAFFQQPKQCLATIYSPRKFFGVPDGGLLITSLHMKEPEDIDVDSITRVSHLIKRLAGDAEDGYLDYQENEKSLNNFEPKQMSKLTNAVLSSIDYKVVRKLRNDNFIFIHNKLKSSNLLNIDMGKLNGPMGYPYLTDNFNLKSMLIKSRIFIPTYWPEVLVRPDAEEVDKKFVRCLNLIPCDQRYSTNDLLKILNKIKV